jgi:uncharacterized FlaG/YvyC family protein
MRQVKRWIAQIDDVLLSTQTGLEFIYDYIIARRKGLISQFIQQKAEEFNTTKEQIKQLVDDVERLLEKLKR